MSLMDRALQAQPAAAAPLRLSPDEAFAAILVASIAADGQLSEAESTRLSDVLATSRVVPRNPPDGGPNVVERALARLNDRGVPAVLAASAEVLPDDLRPTVFAQAADLVLADGRLAGREKQFIDDLQAALAIDEELALRILDVLLIKNRG